MSELSFTDFLAILPETIVVVTALVAIFADVLSGGWKSRVLPVLVFVGLAAAAVVSATAVPAGTTAMAGAVIVDGFSSIFRALVCIVGAMTVMFSPDYLSRRSIRLGEYYALLLSAVFGMMVMVSAGDLLLFYLGLETMSIALYVLAALNRSDPKSIEGGMKYLVLGAFSSGFLLYGIALMYGAVGSINYSVITAYFAQDVSIGPMLGSGIALMLVGFAFKVAAVPFHFWSPDAYEGAPTTITAFMSTGPKAAAFVALIRVFGVALQPAADLWLDVLTWVSIATMIVGNVVALRQSSIIRMLAYSSIAHAGYLLVGVVVGTDAAFAAMGYYLVAYAFMNLGAFAVVILMNRRADGEYRFDDLRGLGFKYPLLGVTMTVFMLSLTGIPPTAGFFGKLYVFSAAVQEGHYLLAIVGVLNSAVAAYYYLRVITLLYMNRAETEISVTTPKSYSTALVLSSIVILVLGLFPEPLLSLLRGAVP